MSWYTHTYVHMYLSVCSVYPFLCLPIRIPFNFFYHFQTDMVDLNQIMRDMATIVVEQGDTIGGWATSLW